MLRAVCSRVQPRNLSVVCRYSVSATTSIRTALFSICAHRSHRTCALTHVTHKTHALTRRRYTTHAQQAATIDLAYTSVAPTNAADASALPHTLVLHGLFGSGNNWRTMSKKLSEATSSNVYLMDLRNHGSSPHSDEMDYNIMADDVKAFIDKHSLGSVSVIGHSMGGKVAMTLALKYPEVVTKLVIVDIAPHSLSNALNTFSKYSSAMKTLDFDTIKTRTEADAALQSVVPETDVRQFLLTNLIVGGDKLKWRCNLPVLHNSMNKLMDFPHLETTYNGPTLFIGGSKSNYISFKHMGAINSLFPSAKVIHLEGAGHWVHAEKPKEFFNVASEFLAK